MRALEERLRTLGSVMVAYSGGVDSAFLAATAHRVLGNRMLAVLADSPAWRGATWSRRERLRSRMGMPLRVIADGRTGQARIPAQRREPLLPLQDELFEGMQALGAELGFAHIAYGMNADDTRDYRPGQRAAAGTCGAGSAGGGGADQAGDSRAGKSGRLPALGPAGCAVPVFARGVWADRDARSAGAGGARRRKFARSWDFASFACAITESWRGWRLRAMSCRAR